MTFLKVDNIKKTYQTRFSNHQVVALKNISFTVEKGEYVAIMGESGSGKSTLLNLLATIDQPSYGTIILNGKDMNTIKEKDAAVFRRNHLGFVFQNFNLLDTLSIKDNILLPLVLAKTSVKEMESRIAPLAEALGISKFLTKFPYELSGGQKQRVATARAVITKPELLLADEPTGALDSKTSGELLNVFKEINENGQTILMVTHSVVAASHANRILFIKDGEVFHQLYRGNKSNDELVKAISATMTALLVKEE